jgi:hypothetical protein
MMVLLYSSSRQYVLSDSSTSSRACRARGPSELVEVGYRLA